MATLPDRTRQKLGAALGLWAGGLIVGPILVVAGLVLRSGLVAKLGLVVAAVGLTGSLLARVLLFGAEGRRRWYVLPPLVLRAAAILLLLYLVVTLRA